MNARSRLIVSPRASQILPAASTTRKSVGNKHNKAKELTQRSEYLLSIGNGMGTTMMADRLHSAAGSNYDSDSVDSCFVAGAFV